MPHTGDDTDEEPSTERGCATVLRRMNEVLVIIDLLGDLIVEIRRDGRSFTVTSCIIHTGDR